MLQPRPVCPMSRRSGFRRHPLAGVSPFPVSKRQWPVPPGMTRQRCWFKRISDFATVLRSQPTGQGPTVCLDEPPQGFGDFSRRLVASEDHLGNPGAAAPDWHQREQKVVPPRSIRLFASLCGVKPRGDRQTVTGLEDQSFPGRLSQSALGRVIHSDRGYIRRQSREELNVAGWTPQRRSSQSGDP